MIRKINNSIGIFLLCLSMISCNSQPADEKRELDNLRKKHPNYEISKLDDKSKNFIKVKLKLKDIRIDTSELLAISRELRAINQVKLPSHQPDMGWNAVAVYDYSGKFLFTISRKNGKTLIIRTG